MVVIMLSYEVWSLKNQLQIGGFFNTMYQFTIVNCMNFIKTATKLYMYYVTETKNWLNVQDASIYIFSHIRPVITWQFFP